MLPGRPRLALEVCPPFALRDLGIELLGIRQRLGGDVGRAIILPHAKDLIDRYHQHRRRRRDAIPIDPAALGSPLQEVKAAA